MLATLDIKLIAVIGVLLLIVVGYFVYSLYKDLVFLKSEINSKESGEFFFKGEEPVAEIEYDDTEEDEELEKHLENIMRQSQMFTNEEHNHSHIQELEPIQETEEVEELQPVQEEPQPKKRKYSKKKVTIKEPTVSIDKLEEPEVIFQEA